MKSAIVSVIIPAKNEADYIGACLQSLSSVRYPEEQYEIILADNGSTDETLAIARSFTVSIVELPDKKTISAVRNGGAAAASGEILVFLDADCTVTEDWLLSAERYFSRRDVVCFGSSPVIPEEATWVEQTWYLARKSNAEVFERDWQESTNMFVRRNAFEEVGGFNEQLVTCEDVDLSYRLLRFGKIISDSRIKAVHHRDPKTVKEFFFKEKWRGTSNYSGLLQHGVKAHELPSLFLPIYFVALLLAAMIFAVSGRFALSVLYLVLAELPVAGIVWLKLRRNFSSAAFGRLLILYNIYFIARAAALLPLK